MVIWSDASCRCVYLKVSVNELTKYVAFNIVETLRVDKLYLD